MLATAVYVIVRSFFNINYSIDTILLSLVGVSTIVNFSWFIFELIIFYIIFYISFKYFRDNNIIILFLFILIFIGVTIIFNFDIWWYVSALSFPIGVLFAEKEASLIKIFKENNIILITFIILFIIGILKLDSIFSIKVLKIDLLGSLLKKTDYFLASISFTILMGIMLARFKFKNQVLFKIGLYSSELYLIQGLFLKGFKEIIIINNNMLYLSVTLIFSIIATFIFKYIVEYVIKLYDRLLNNFIIN